VPPEDAPPIKLRAEKLLAELGLLSYRTPSGVLFYSLPGMGKAYECVTEIVDYR
jgi:ATP-dependent 26S proteasome regulatory subunit